MSQKVVCLTLGLLLCLPVASVLARANDDAWWEFRTGPNPDCVILTDPKPLNQDGWLHYDDRSCENSLGATCSCQFHEAIKLTPTELAGLNGYIDKIKVMHGCPLYPGCPEMPYEAWIYKGVNHCGDPDVDATILSSGICPAIDDYFWINLTHPYRFNETDTLWVGVAFTHPAGAYPAGFDEDSCVSGKSDWLTLEDEGTWYELGCIGYPGNWCLEVHVTENDTMPPSTQLWLGYTYPEIVTFNATDDLSGVAFTDYQLDHGLLSNYTGPFQVPQPGIHSIMYYSVDKVGNHENPWTQNFTVTVPLTVSFSSGFGITTSIHNPSDFVINVNGSILLSGLVLPKEKRFFTNIQPRENFTIRDKVLGFGPITISVIFDGKTHFAHGSIFLFFVLIPNGGK